MKQEEEHLKILFFTNGTASHVWRADGVARRMNETTPHEMAVTTYDQWKNETYGANIVIMEMLTSHAMVETAKNMGAKVIYEADDIVLDAYGRERKNLMHVDKSFRSSAIETIRKCDALTVATEAMAKNYRQFTDAPIYVLPILMDYQYYGDAELVDLPKRNSDEIRIGWFGGKGHFEDLRMVLPAIKNVLKRDKRVKFVYCGYGGMDSDSLAMKAQWGEDVLKEIPRERREFAPGAPEDWWPYKHRFLDFDIGIAPLIDDEFNNAKCYTKWMEYSVFKTPVVASPTVYGEVIDHGKTGLIAKTTKEWENHLMALVNDATLRQKIGTAAAEDVRVNHNIEDHWTKWVDTYGKVLRS
ncbi:MAG: glycosyltransferase [Nitrosopumilus sp.]